MKTAAVRTISECAPAQPAAPIKRRRARAAGSVRPGQIFVMDFGGGAGHTGMVRGIRDGKLVTIEGNTNDGGSREGIGVFERTGRTIGSVNKGFLDYSEA